MARLLAATLAALALAAGAATAATDPPSIRFVELAPARVAGAHFEPGEQVTVTLYAGAARRVRTVRATRNGAFAIDFGTLRRKDRCSGSVAVVAVGANGERAGRKLPPMQCIAAMTALPNH
jgi:hypothetical protein